MQWACSRYIWAPLNLKKCLLSLFSLDFCGALAFMLSSYAVAWVQHGLKTPRRLFVISIMFKVDYEFGAMCI